MATAKLAQHMDFIHTENELNAVIISDSYLKYYYFHCDQIVGNTIQLGTHVHNLDDGTSLNHLVLTIKVKVATPLTKYLTIVSLFVHGLKIYPN